MSGTTGAEITLTDQPLPDRDAELLAAERTHIRRASRKFVMCALR